MCCGMPNYSTDESRCDKADDVSSRVNKARICKKARFSYSNCFILGLTSLYTHP